MTGDCTQAYEGLQTAHMLKQEYTFLPAKLKEVYLTYLLEHLEDHKVLLSKCCTLYCMQVTSQNVCFRDLESELWCEMKCCFLSSKVILVSLSVQCELCCDFSSLKMS